jgi:predicted dehydrogenase
MSREIRIAMIGYKFMGRAHSLGYKAMPLFFDNEVKPVMKVICGRDEAAVTHQAERYGWENVETDWRRTVSRNDIDLVDICTPIDSHRDIALSAAKAGKAIFCEKPLAKDLEEAQQMLNTVEQSKVPHFLACTFRTVPAVILAKQLVEEGELGEIFHWTGHWLSDWAIDPQHPLEWRLQKTVSGYGALSDIGSHVVDLSRYTIGAKAGKIESVTGALETYIKTRPLTAGSPKRGKVEVDDAAVFLSRFENGALGSFALSRVAAGNKDRFFFEINGSKGSVIFDYANMNELRFYSNTDSPRLRGFRTIRVGNELHPYGTRWGGTGVEGHGNGYADLFVFQAYELMRNLAGDRRLLATFHDGVVAQAIFDAVAQSAAEKHWIQVKAS